MRNSVGYLKPSPAGRAWRSPVAAFLVFLVRFYQSTFSTFFAGSCRFHPSCSQYAVDALRTYGALRGSYLAVRRVFRCHPWHPGGYDPVP